MVFSSVAFLYYFLPLALLLYLIVPKKLKNTALLIVSLFFYGWGEPKFLFLMAGTILVGFLSGLVIEKFRGRVWEKVGLYSCAAFCLGALGYFKYMDFFVENFNRVTGLEVPLLKLSLPIGISFYTFQLLSYVIDVYRQEVPAQKNLVSLGCYVTLFPQLIAGPIVRYSTIARELEERSHSFEKISSGITRFIIGLSKKVILANTLGELCDTFISSNDKSVAFYWLFAICYALQIYFDFSGYSDMAIGLGRILGFEFLENFNYPYVARSVTEFWRRWHISLGTWFRDYVYIPLGGNRVGRKRLLFNIFAVWFLTGFWHGAEWNFIIWGLFFGVLLTLEKFFFLKWLEKHRVLSHLYVVLAVVISFVIFSANNLGEAIARVGGMFGFGEARLVSESFFYYLRSYGLVIFLGILFATPLMNRLKEYILKNKITRLAFDILEIPVLCILLLIVTGFIADGSFNPFLYFRF